VDGGRWGPMQGCRDAGVVGWWDSGIMGWWRVDGESTGRVGWWLALAVRKSRG
jgi:hypothetical protein